MDKLILITCYFGKFPSYFRLFLESCSWNPEINWLIITDDQTPYDYPRNVKVKFSTLQEVESVAKAKIGSWINLKNAYKLCDFKPTYGLLFEQYLKDYKYWGHCDIDLIWGNLSSFLHPLLQKNHVRLFKFGHLTIYQNNPFANKLFMLPYSKIQYKTALSSKISCGFDEQNATWILAEENGIDIYHENICFDIKRPGRDIQLTSYTSKNYPEQCFIIQNKRIYQFYKGKANTVLKKEQAYIHFQQRRPLFRGGKDNAIYQITQTEIKPLKPDYKIEDCFANNRQYFSTKYLITKKRKELIQIIKYNLLKHHILK